jgi:hypothetical protein
MNIPGEIRTWADVKEGDTVLAHLVSGRHLVTVTAVRPEGERLIVYYQRQGKERFFRVSPGDLTAVVTGHARWVRHKEETREDLAVGRDTVPPVQVAQGG